MTYIDLRKLSSGELKQIRRQVIRLKEMGKSGKEIEELTGVRQNRASEIWTAYQSRGEAALEVNQGGRPEGAGRILLPAEEAEVRETIETRQPTEFGLPGSLWTLKKVCEYVWKTYRKKMSDRCASDYMRRWGLSCQRPVKRARKQDPERIQRWKREEYPAIAQQAQEENAEIYWGDETGISNCENYERGFSPQGTATDFAGGDEERTGEYDFGAHQSG